MALIARAPLGLVAAMSAALMVAIGLAVVPVMTSGEDLETSTVRYWWARLSPRGYAPRALERAAIFFASSSEAYCSRPEDLSTAWGTVVAEPAADSIFARLLETGSPEGRLYALVGLSAISSGLIDSAIRRAMADTATVQVFDDSLRKVDTTSVADVVARNPLSRWSIILRKLTSRKCAA
jgi:hypothetical protein